VKILRAELVSGVAASGPRGGVLRDDVPRFAFAGRSNVGKSSLLNALVRQKVARTSAAAGKTRQVNVFRVTAQGGLRGNSPWVLDLVDLPGYGYARGGEESVRELAGAVDAYFAANAAGFGATFLLIDSRHPVQASDVQAHEWISQAMGPPRIVATKEDKLSRAERAAQLKAFARAFGQEPLSVSATSGEGLDQLWKEIAGLARAGCRDVNHP
jgi:GTP-binding protein